MHVMVVDDSPTMQRMITSTLQEAGFKVTLAEHGIIGLRLLDEISPELIISDLNMYEMGGLEFVNSVRQKPEYENTPILFLTTESAEDLKEAGREAGASGWVQKPFDPKELVQVVNQLLEKH